MKITKTLIIDKQKLINTIDALIEKHSTDCLTADSCPFCTIYKDDCKKCPNMPFYIKDQDVGCTDLLSFVGFYQIEKKEKKLHRIQVLKEWKQEIENYKEELTLRMARILHGKVDRPYVKSIY